MSVFIDSATPDVTARALSNQDQQTIAGFWGRVGEWASDPTTKSLAARGNFRLNVKAALAAVAQTVGVIAKIGAGVTLSPMTLLGLGAASVGAIAACISAVRESMREAEFLVLVVLSQEHEGTTEQQLKADVRMFLKHDPRIFPWYLGIDQELFAKCDELNYDPDFGDVVRELVKSGHIRREGENLRYEDKIVSLKVV
jgi:hypothetical protein